MNHQRVSKRKFVFLCDGNNLYFTINQLLVPIWSQTEHTPSEERLLDNNLLHRYMCLRVDILQELVVFDLSTDPDTGSPCQHFPNNDGTIPAVEIRTNPNIHDSSTSLFCSACGKSSLFDNQQILCANLIPNWTHAKSKELLLDNNVPNRWATFWTFCRTWLQVKLGLLRPRVVEPQKPQMWK